MSIARDGSSRGRDRKTNTNLRAEYTDLINADEGLVEARRWIERVTFTPFKNNDFRDSLADGILLCELVVNVASMSIGRINRSSTQYAGIDNIKLFIRACEALGFEKSQLFEADDLQEIPVKRGQSVLERAKESQQRLRRVALTVYYLGKYANENLNFTGSSVLKEEFFSHLLENKLPELPILEGADLGRRISQYESQQAIIPETLEHLETTPEKDKNNEIVTDTGNFSAKRNAFQQLEQESIKQAEEEESLRRRRRSFSSGDKENEFDSEDALKRRKSLGSKPVWKEGDSRYKHKKEILGGWKDPIKTRRERIQNSSSTDASPPKHQITMRSPVDLQKKRSKFEEMERSASEEAEGRRARPKSWVGGDIKSRSASLKDRTNKFEDMQRQADKESAVLHGELRMPAVNNDVKRHDRSPVLTGAVNLKDKHSKFEQLDKAAHKQTLVLQGRRDEMETDFTYDIGDKVNGPISLPGSADPKLRDKRKQFESLDYKAQRESTILRLHSGKSFDDPNQNPIPLNTASRRADPKPRPKSNIFDYQRFPPVEVDRREILNEPVQPREMDFSESTPEQWNSFDDHGSSKSVSPTPPAPPRGDSLRYHAKKPDENVNKPATKTPLYSSFAAKQDPSKDKGQKGKELKYKEFISYPVVKQRDRVDRYNAAIQGLSKEPTPKTTSTGEKPRKKSLNSNEWIKHKAQEEPEIDLPKRQIKKIWDREPDAEEEETVIIKKPLEPVDTSFDERKISTHVANVQNMSYRDFTAAPKNLAKDRVISRTPVIELVSSRKKSENRNEPFSNFAQPVTEDVKNPTKKQSMSYHDFAVPPPKVESKADAAARAQKVKEMTRKFQEIEAEQNKPKPAGPPGLKSLVDRDELVRYERESRARSWYGVDDEEFEGATRRRVRRWSDYEYEEGDRMMDAPREMQNGDSNNVEVYPSVFNEPKPYQKPVEPEPVRVQETRPVESAKQWYDVRPPPPIPVAPQETEIKPEVMRPVKSILRHDPVATVSHDYEATHPEPAHERYQTTQPEPVRQQYQATQPEPAHERYQTTQPEPDQYQRTEPQPEPQHIRTQPRAMPSHGRTVGSRSWNDFESSRRKKSMELLENRPAAKPYEPRDTTRVESEPYKLKRPTDYMPKHHLDQAPKTSKPTSQQPEVRETHQYNYESKPQDSQMPTSYPTYYEPDINAGYSPATVETGKPLFVSAKLHEDDEIQMKMTKPTPPSISPSYDIPVAEKVSPPVVESNVESEPHDFKAQQKLWEYKTTQIHEEPVPPQPDVGKNSVNQPEVHKYVIEPQPVTRQQHEDPPKPYRPQVFAIVGTAHPVRPSTAEPVQQVSPNLPQVSPKEHSPKIQKQAETRPQDSKPKLLRSASGAKVFDFNEENEEQKPDEQVAPLQKSAPAKAEDDAVVVETVTVVQKGPGLDDDIFKSFNEEEEKMKRNLQDPVYREKLRKEVEEENRKQREETRYLTNLQMGQPLGPNEDNFIHEEEERLRQDKLESIPPKKDIYDYNANRKDYPIIEKQVNGLQQSPNEKEIPLYPVERQRENKPDDRRFENDERRGQPPPQKSAEDRGRHEYRENQDPRGRSPQRRPSRERERPEDGRRQSPHRYPSSERERYEQERRGRSPHRRQSPGRERQDHERRNRYPSSERDRYERDQRGRSPHSSERERYERDRRGRSPHRSRDEYYRENERRGRDPREANERPREQERYKYDRREAERREQEHSQRRDSERREHERREAERKEAERREHERRDAERKEAERKEHERREAERREHERIEAERREYERKEAERREQERIEQERIEAERREYERREAERREQERIDAERRERERRERERIEKERLERLERERIEKERREQERIAIEQERLEQERREREEQLERERLEKERMEQERMRVEQMERERIEQERIERERREQERIQRERIEQERREQEKIEWERIEQERIERERYEQQRLEDERRRRGHEQDRYERDRYDHERRDTQHRGRGDYYDDRRRDRREQERYEQERREQERRDKHRREQEQYSPEDRERHRQEQQHRVREMIANQRQEEIEQDQYKEMLSKEQQYLYGASEKRRNSEDEGMWKKVEDGSGYDIYSTFMEDERSPIVCTSCGLSIVRDRAMYVRELNQYWHETCFRCVVCHVIFGSREQRSPLKVTDSLLHCENCFITNEGDKCTEV